MTENNTNCVICGKGYYLCIGCKDKMKAQPWRIHTDTSEHFKILGVITGYKNKTYDKSEAKEKLSKLDLSDVSTFNAEIINIINEITIEDNVPKNTVRVKKKIVVNDSTAKNTEDEN